MTAKQTTTNKTFGFFFSTIFGLLTIFMYDGTIKILDYALIALTLFTFLLTIFLPKYLSVFKFFWFKLGHYIGKFTNPIVLGIIFFAIISPIAILMRILGRDELEIYSKPKNSFWKKRKIIDKKITSFKNQF